MKNFKKYQPREVNRRIISIEGLEKSGKTHWALTAPGPIAYFNFDVGFEGVIDKFVDGTVSSKDVYVADYQTPLASENQSLYLNVWKKFWDDYTNALSQKEIRTLVVDTATECWEILRMGRFGKLSKVLPIHYGPVNAEFEYLFKTSYEHDKNIILIHKYVDEYINDKPTGKFKRAGYSKMGYVVQDVLRAHREENTADFSVSVLMSRKNIDKIGMEFEGDLSSFPYVMAGITDTTPEEWS